MNYTERVAPAWVAGPVACVWSTVATGDAAILPDACADLIHVEGSGTFVAGPDTQPGDPARGRVTGVRLRTGHVAAALGVPAEELRDRRISLEDLWGRSGGELARRVEGAPTACARQALLAQAVARRATPADPIAVGAVALLARDPGRQVAGVAAELAVSERHLLRRVRAAVGYGPKTLARILRFQRLLALGEDGGDSLAALALTAGYADQPHMTGEVRRLAGASPTAVLGVARARGDVELVRSVQDANLRAA